MKDETLVYLLQKYIDCQCSEEEVETLLHWLKSSDDDDCLDIVTRPLWGSICKNEVRSDAERDAQLRGEAIELLRRLKQEKEISLPNTSRWKSKGYRLVLSVASAAAVVGLVLLGSFFYSLPDGTEKDLSVVVSQIPMLPVADNPDIQLVSSNNVISLKKGSTVSYSSDGSVAVDEKKVAEAVDKTEQCDQIIVPKGKYTRLILADGSSLHINAGTTVVYPRSFKKNRREIYVDGEVFIDVKHDEAAPFFVKTAKFEVEVLGTAFDVNAYKEDTFAEVVLLRGSVNIRDTNKKALRLLPNQQALINEGSISGMKEVNASDYISWIDGLLVLDGKSLDEICRNLSRRYGENIGCASEIKELKIKGVLDVNRPLDEILQNLSIAAPIEYTKSDTGFNISKK